MLLSGVQDASLVPEKGLFNMTPEQAAALKTCGLSTLQQVSDKLHAELVCSTCHEQSRRVSPQQSAQRTQAMAHGKRSRPTAK